ncbi:hypothetical protein FKR81_21370 [Lentzea tibetensis]|uniref:Uncharacterized protein n=1 Tax=Lentzea tibetensis TaxID=2591470 RepID=A0A563ERE5_9PSEU|nr:hypothetical protein [Lentzea tibetensis]TWP50256.1 hypothetical protein FKR81_21370 [Lentzea tibetensis]
MVALSAVLLLAAGGIGFGLGRATGPDAARSNGFTVTGSMTVSDCRSRGYNDIHAGAQVEVTNQANDVLGVGVLESDKGYCKFKFSVSGVPSGEKLYGVTTGNSNRGVIWKTEQQARTEGFHLTLGD